MANSFPLDDFAFKPISEGIARRVRGVLNLAPGSFVEMGETFATWSVRYHVKPGESRPLSVLAEEDGRYYHQLYARLAVPEVPSNFVDRGAPDVAPVGAAWSVRQPGTNAWSISQVSETWLAGAIDRAIKQVDGMVGVPEKAEARLLSVPAYAVHAFWLWSNAATPDPVYVIAAPETLVHIVAGQLMTSGEFVLALSREEPIKGLIHEPRPIVPPRPRF